MATKSSEIASFYDQNPGLEHIRLKENPIEYAVTWEYIKWAIAERAHSTSNPLRILDIGGGTGVYAVQLAKLGHEVTLSDISAQELELAKQHAANEHVSFARVTCMDARTIRGNVDVYVYSHYDIVLCLGPFYHLLYEEERKRLLEDLIVVTKPRGYIFAAFVTMFAHLRDVARKDPGRLLRENEFYSKYFEDGQYTRTLAMHHTHSTSIQQLFKQFKDEAKLEKVVGTEVFLAGRISSELQGLSNEELKPWIDIVLRFAEDPSIAGAADHILVVSRRL